MKKDYSFLIPLTMLAVFLLLLLTRCSKEGRCKVIYAEVYKKASPFGSPAHSYKMHFIVHQHDHLVMDSDTLKTSRGQYVDKWVDHFVVLDDKIKYDEATMGCPTCDDNSPKPSPCAFK